MRFGDPECQGLMMQLETDLLDIVMAASEGRLQTVPLKWSSASHALTVVIAAKGYPGTSEKGCQIDGLDQQLPAKVGHAVRTPSGGQYCMRSQWWSLPRGTLRPLRRAVRSMSSISSCLPRWDTLWTLLGFLS